MTFAYLVFFSDETRPAARIADGDLDVIAEILAATPAMSEALVFTPEQADDPYTRDGPPPQLGLQLYFATLEQLEAAIGPAGHLQVLARPWAGLEGCRVTQQAMVARRFPVAGDAARSGPPPEGCSYVVHYPGPAEDYNAWIKSYLRHHPSTMARLPGIREIEILTRVDWSDSMAWDRVHHMQRNRVMFDDALALTRALTSPVRAEMRADFEAFPPYQGGNAHYPMRTVRVRPAG